MTKDFGPTSGYLDPGHKAWEQVTWRTGRPVLDTELNLSGELFLQQLYRSGKICSGFLFSRDYFSPDLYPVSTTYVDEPGNYCQDAGSGITANRFYFGPGQAAHVADMLVYLKPNGSDWIPINLDAAPTGVGVKRWDFVFIEVWRAGLSGDAATDTAAGIRDTNGKIFYNGWADSPTVNNLTDDVLNAGVGVETSRRVQVQWRIRVVSDLDMYTYPDGLDDTIKVFARGPDAAVSVISYTNQASVGDPGLWISTGHATPVDGNVYAIPLCAVARRNQSTWDQDTNQNGGSGTLPTAITYTDIVEQDILDLRKTVSDTLDWEALLKKNFSWLLDGRLKTNFEDPGLGGGVYGTYYTQIDEIGPVDTPGATRISQPDGYQRHFSDAITENIAYETVTLADRTSFTSPTIWQTGDTFDITLPVTSDGILDRVVELGLLSGYGSTHFSVAGINTKTLTITLDATFQSSIPVGSRTSIDLYICVGIVFDGGKGLSRTPHYYKESIVTGANFTSLDAGDSLVWETVPPAAMSTTAMDTDSILYKPSRTATLVVNNVYTNQTVYSRTTSTTVLPDDVRSIQGIYDAVADPGKTTDLYLSLTGNVVTHGVVPATHRQMIVDYTSKEAIASGQQVSLYYQTPSQQSLYVAAGGLNVSTAKIHLLYAPDWLYVTTAGSGGHMPGYPYIAPGHQIPISNASMSAGDHLLDLNQPVQVDDFGTSGQLIRLPINVPMALIPYFYFKTPNTDSEGRHFYNDVQTTTYDDVVSGSPVTYQPSVFAKLLYGDYPHKVMYPCIGLCLENTNIGKRGSLILMIFTRTSDDDQNAVIFDSAGGGDSCVALYRLKGNPTISPRKYQLGLTLI